jgi:peptidoglycan/LPS O-acetylase OafA/YrhL
MTKSTLSSVSVGADNNLNLIRFLAALLVLVSHSYSIVSGDPKDEPLTDILGRNLGSVAVDVFFVISGFLISKSFYRRRSISDYFLSRFLRIYPALIFSSLIVVVILGLIFSRSNYIQYITDASVWNYVMSNSFMLAGPQYLLPGVFENNPIGPTVNGSLWTLPYELRMYIVIAVFLLCAGFVNRYLRIRVEYSILMLTLFLVTVYCVSFYYDIGHENFIRLSTMFVVGACAYFWAGAIRLSTTGFLMCLLSYLALLVFVPLEVSEFFYLIALPYGLFYLAYIPSGFVRRFNSLEDYSYGIYIYAFPIQQAFVYFLPRITIIEMVVYSSVVTLMFAIFSWKAIERPSLSIKNRFKKS